MRGMMGRANLGVFAAVTLIASGCVSLRPYDPGPGKRVAASFVQDSYASGETVNVTIANLSEVTLFYPDGFCKSQLQKKDRGGWLTVSARPKSCPAEQGFLDPGQAVVHQFQLPPGVSGGTYRFALPMPAPYEAVAPEADLITPSFRVESPVLATTSRSN
jgi:hypothetical protein